MSDKKNNAATRLAGAAILVMAATGVPALAQTPPASNDQVVTIQNTTNAPLELGSPEWPKGFSQGAPIGGQCRKEQRIPAGGQCLLPIRFVPLQVGAYSADLIIPINDGKTPPLVIHLTGTGVAAAQSGGVHATVRDRGGGERR